MKKDMMRRLALVLVLATILGYGTNCNVADAKTSVITVTTKGSLSEGFTFSKQLAKKVLKVKINGKSVNFSLKKSQIGKTIVPSKKGTKKVILRVNGKSKKAYVKVNYMTDLYVKPIKFVLTNGSAFSEKLCRNGLVVMAEYQNGKKQKFKNYKIKAAKKVVAKNGFFPVTIWYKAKNEKFEKTAYIPVVTAPVVPTVTPTEAPEEPITEPTAVPTMAPTVTPTAVPTTAPTVTPTVTPTAEPTTAPTAEPKFHKVTVKGGNFQNADTVNPDRVANGSWLTIKPEIPFGYYFAGWVNEKGTLISYKEIYSFYVKSDMTLQATFSKVALEKKEPLLTFSGAGFELLPELLKVAVFMAIEIPEGFQKGEWGILFTDKEVNEETCVVGSNNVHSAINNQTTTIGSAAWTCNLNFSQAAWENKKTITCRSYAEVSDANGNKKIIYSPILSFVLHLDTAD